MASQYVSATGLAVSQTGVRQYIGPRGGVVAEGSVVSGAGSAAGTASVAGVGAVGAIEAGTGSSAGVATVLGVGGVILSAVGAADGAATVSGVGVSVLPTPAVRTIYPRTEFRHAPGEVLDFLIDADPFLLGTDETLGETASSVTASGATIDSLDFTDTSVTVWLSGGTLGVPIKLTAVLRTSGGRTFKQVYVIPFGEPVSLAQAKAQCRIELDDTDNDEALAGYISAARAAVENFTSKLLVRRSVTQSFDTFGLALDLYKGPDVADVVVTYDDAGGAQQDYADFVLAARNGSALVYPARDGWWPTLGRPGVVTVGYTAGYGEGEAPPDLVQAMLVLIGHYYENREAVVGTSQVAALPMGVDTLCWPYRRISL